MSGGMSRTRRGAMKPPRHFTLVLGRICHVAIGRYATSLCGRLMAPWFPRRPGLSAREAARRADCKTCRKIIQNMSAKTPHPRYVVVCESFLAGDEPLVLRDVGPWDQHPTVTNAAERVVQDLVAQGRLEPKQRLLYYDSEGELTEILHDGERFTGFRHPPEAEQGMSEGERP